MLSGLTPFPFLPSHSPSCRLPRRPTALNVMLQRILTTIWLMKRRTTAGHPRVIIKSLLVDSNKFSSCFFWIKFRNVIRSRVKEIYEKSYSFSFSTIRLRPESWCTNDHWDNSESKLQYDADTLLPGSHKSATETSNEACLHTTTRAPAECFQIATKTLVANFQVPQKLSGNSCALLRTSVKKDNPQVLKRLHKTVSKWVRKLQESESNCVK